MFFYINDSSQNIVHLEDCFHIKGISEDSLSSFENYNDVQENGFRICKHCNTIANAYRREKDKLHNYCMKNGYAIFLQGDTLIVNSHMSCWKITLSRKGNTMILYHKNTRGYNDGEIENDIEYHYQNVIKQDLFGYLEYISEHDTFRYKNPLDIHRVAERKPTKGTKRYRKVVKINKRKEKRKGVYNVMQLFNSLDKIDE